MCFRYSSRVVAPHGVEFPPGQRRFQKVGGIGGSLGGSGPHQGVEFVDEKDYPSLRFGNFLDDRLQTLLVLSLKLCPGNEGPQVQGKEFLFLQGVWNISGNDASGQSFGDGSLPHSGFPQ